MSEQEVYIVVLNKVNILSAHVLSGSDFLKQVAASTKNDAASCRLWRCILRRAASQNAPAASVAY